MVHAVTKLRGHHSETADTLQSYFEQPKQEMHPFLHLHATLFFLWIKWKH